MVIDLKRTSPSHLRVVASKTDDGTAVSNSGAATAGDAAPSSFAMRWKDIAGTATASSPPKRVGSALWNAKPTAESSPLLALVEKLDAVRESASVGKATTADVKAAAAALCDAFSAHPACKQFAQAIDKSLTVVPADKRVDAKASIAAVLVASGRIPLA